jgi:4-nitrophenyl phosphatase
MKTITELAELYDIFLLDCDGVLWQGSNVIDRSFEVISWLCQQKGKKVFFVSNSSGRTRDDYVEKIRNLGFQGCTRNMIYGSAYTTAKYLREKFPEIKKIYVVGMNSIRKEMAEVGIESHGGEDDESFSHDKLMTLDEFENY